MINKIYKRIYNKYSKIFKFFFALRYVFAIFTLAISIFLSVPKFFNYEKKQEAIREYLIKSYHLELKDFSTIEFNIFPLPNLSINDANFLIKKKLINVKSKKINIFLDLKNIYNYENFKAKKIAFTKNEIFVDIHEFKDLILYFEKLKSRSSIKDLTLYLKKNNKQLIKLENISFSNYGYNRYNFNGKIFNKKFKLILKNNNKDLNFKILDAGVKASFKFDDKNYDSTIKGNSKINLSNNLISFDFSLNRNQLKIENSNFRNKDISLSLDSLIKFNPYFSVISEVNINEIEKNLINKLSLSKILTYRDFIKKLNNTMTISYKSKIFFTELIESYSSKLSLAYGRLVFVNKIMIVGGEINCKGDSLLIDEYPRINFICLIDLKNKKKLFKKFSITKNIDNNPSNVVIEGSLNLLNKKINFKKINLNEDYLFNDEDLKFFKDKFEGILFEEDFFQIFNKNKIKKFLLEVI
tara:strand:- start:351 stop:1754 length:1404 start_codon:yes stop_codon:yes gene_type:complete